MQTPSHEFDLAAAGARSAVPLDAVRAYRSDGFVKIRSALSREEVDRLRDAVDRQLAGLDRSATAYDFQNIAHQVWNGAAAIDAGAATRFDMSRFKSLIDADPAARPLFDPPSPGAPTGRFFYDAAGWRRYPGIRAAACRSRLPEIAAALLDTSYLHFWEDTTFVKTPGATQRTAFHQDYTYFQISGRKCCIAWIALDKADAATGALEYVAGSHLWDREFAPNLLIAQTTTSGGEGERLPDIEADRDAYPIIRVDAEPGDVIFHDVMIVHGSAGNTTSDRMRRAISFRYCGDDIRYRAKPGAIPQPMITQPLADGDPLFSPDYPLVWPADFRGELVETL